MAGRDVHFVKQTPTFIKNFKNQIGYKEPDNVDSKFKKLEKSSKDDEEDRECEQPTVVLGSNVTAVEANEFLAKRQEEECDDQEDENDKDTKEVEPEGSGKVMFRKPKKRKSEEMLTENKDKKKKVKDKHKTATKSSCKAVKNSSLLSFGDEEEEEG